jgi:hypothetical protein
MENVTLEEEINKYKKFKKVDGATYRKVNQFLRKRTYITAREWALARLCTDFRTSGGAEMTFIGKHLPELVPFMEDTYSPQAVNQARNSFKKKVRKSSATFFYGAMCGFFTTDELDDLLFEASEVARFLLEVEGTTLDIDEEIDIEDRITNVMRGVGEAAKTILKTRGEEPLQDKPIGMSKISKKIKKENQLNDNPNQSEYERFEKTRLMNIEKPTDVTQFYLDKSLIGNEDSFFDNTVLPNHDITDILIIKDKNKETNAAEVNTESIPDVKIVKRQHDGDQQL